MLSVPCVRTASDNVFSDQSLSCHLDEVPPTAPPPATSAPVRPKAEVVPLNVPETSTLQNIVLNWQQRFLKFLGGSMFWRVFVGCGFAVFVGALTLLVFGPNPEQAKQEETKAKLSSMPAVDQAAPSEPRRVGQPPRESPIELTVSTQDSDGPIQAQLDDPFIEENLVHGKVVHAVHLANADQDDSGAVQTVSHQQPRTSTPVWLSGTIEAEDDTPQIKIRPKR